MEFNSNGKTMELNGKRIVLGVTGGIAAYKAAELTRLLIQAGAKVQVVMTEAACRFITPVTMQALSGNPVYTDLWDGRVPNNMAHIELSRACDAIVVAPASAVPGGAISASVVRSGGTSGKTSTGRCTPPALSRVSHARIAGVALVARICSPTSRFSGFSESAQRTMQICQSLRFSVRSATTSPGATRLVFPLTCIKA